MRRLVVAVLVPVIDDAAHVAQAAEPVLRQALVAEAAVEALDIGVLHRLAGLDEARLDPFWATQVCIVRPANSGPLPVRITLGSPRSPSTWSSKRVTYSAGIEVSTAICTASLLQSSTTVSVFTRRRLASSSKHEVHAPHLVGLYHRSSRQRLC